jgi:hypothetical protein
MINILKTGKLPFKEDKRDLKHSDYRIERTIAPIITPFGMDKIAKYQNLNWCMLGNGPDDTVKKGFEGAGDCVLACAGHSTILWTTEAGDPVSITGANSISDYSSITGYVIGDDSTDQGTDMRTALLYRQKTGIVDAKGIRHKIGPFVGLDWKKLDSNGNPYEIFEGLDIYDAVEIGINFPDSAMTQFNANQDWTVVKGSKIDGGHAICQIVAFDGTWYYIVTWGKCIRMHKDFFNAYIEEAWGIFTPDMLNPTTGLNIDGYNSTQLLVDFNAITTLPTPSPSPTPTPTPTPTPVITPTVAISDIKTIMATSSKITKAKLVSSINSVLSQVGGS